MKKHHWHVFWHEKLFEKHPQPHCQTSSSSAGQTMTIDQNSHSEKLFFDIFY